MSELPLEDYKVINLPDSAFYISEYITEAEEAELLSQVYRAPRPKWTVLATSGRRLQNWGGVPTARGMLAESLPRWLQDVADRVRRAAGAGATPNHVLVNEYLAGQGILPHEDGAVFLPVVMTLSLGSPCALRLSAAGQEGQEGQAGRGRRDVGALLLEPRSLLVLRDALYTGHLHGIEPLHRDVLDDTVLNLALCSPLYKRGDVVDRTTRVSLTIRHVPKATSFKIDIGNKSR